MNYLSNKYIIENKIENRSMYFNIDYEIDNEFFLNLHLEDNNVIEDHEIPLKNNSKHVYRSDDIEINNEIHFKDYKILKIRFLLKFKEDSLCKVSSIYLTCIKNDKLRFFSICIDDIYEMGYTLDIKYS
tara:strand:+ start:709 stop:1095 length:387 start_codon:yes stop_codon:yes gene_type:complete